MLDFTSALYLGLQHSSGSLRSWQQLTTGAPAALVEPAEAGEFSREMAELQGSEAATPATSTLHLVWDLFGLLTDKPVAIFMDAGAYPITRWGVQRAAMRGAAVRIFRHHDPTALKVELGAALRDRAPVVVTDGFCPSCGRVAPLADYQALTRSAGGWLVVDDTQALGILGHSPSARMPYGHGGGGSLRWSGISGPETLVFSSLAKGFGAPLAVLAGSKASIGKFEEESLTRVHCSPPSIAAFHAAEQAVICNRRNGEARRAKLLELVRRFRRGLNAIGVVTGRGLFPVQTLRTKGAVPAPELHRRLADRGVHAVLNRAADGQPRLSFILTSRHTSAEIDAAVTAVAEASRIQSVTSQEINHEEPVYH